MRAPCVNSWVSSCPALGLQVLVKVGQYCGPVSPFTAHTTNDAAAAASTELQHLPLLYQPCPLQPNSVLPLHSGHTPFFLTRAASFLTPLWRHLWPRPLFPYWLVLALDRWPLVYNHCVSQGADARGRKPWRFALKILDFKTHYCLFSI